jgi:hypothetical protein
MVGGATTLFYGVMAWRSSSMRHVAPVPASVLAYIAAVPLNFLLQRGFAFRSENRVQRDLPRYLLVHAGNIAASAARDAFRGRDPACRLPVRRRRDDDLRARGRLPFPGPLGLQTLAGLMRFGYKDIP